LGVEFLAPTALGEEGAGYGSEDGDDELNDSFPIDFFH
jgi:hypothetical protein